LVAAEEAEMTHRTSRREFLRGQSAGEDFQARRASPNDLELAQDSAADLPLLQISRPAMACEFQVVFNAGQYAQATEAAMEALDLIETLEERWSYFRPTSHVSRLNMVAAEMEVEVDEELFDLLRLARTIHDETQGAFDITSAPLWETWGFARRQGALPAESDVAEALNLVGNRYVQLDAARRTVRFAKPGVRINLGSIGKGYALDCAAALLARRGLVDFLFHGGQSSVLGRGSRAGPTGPASSGQGWLVGVKHPLRPKQRLAEIRLCDRALGTSGSAMQFFRHRGRRYAHILDPRTGWPAEGVLSVTVVASNAALADALSTAFFVLGPEAAETYCRAHPGIAALFACPLPGSERLQLHAFGFGPDELRLLGEGSSASGGVKG
jgi:thiamine biosynthesis lipoprotein